MATEQTHINGPISAAMGGDSEVEEAQPTDAAAEGVPPGVDLGPEPPATHFRCHGWTGDKKQRYQTQVRRKSDGQLDGEERIFHCALANVLA